MCSKETGQSSKSTDGSLIIIQELTRATDHSSDMIERNIATHTPGKNASCRFYMCKGVCEFHTVESMERRNESAIKQKNQFYQT